MTKKQKIFKCLSNYRYWVIGILSLASFFTLCSEQETYGALCEVKTTGIIIAATLCVLWRKWWREGTIPELKEIMEYDDYD